MPYFGQRPSYRSTFDPESEPIVQKPRGGLAGLMEQLPAQTQEGLQSYGMGDILMDLGMPAAASAGAWKLSPNASSWLRRAFEGGEREIPLQEGTPRRVPIQSGGLVKNPITYELPESADELAPLLEQLGGSYRKTKPTGKVERLSQFTLRKPLPGGGYEVTSRSNPYELWANEDELVSRGVAPDVPTLRHQLLQEWVKRGGQESGVEFEDFTIKALREMLVHFPEGAPSPLKRKLPPISGGVDVPPKKMSKKQLQHFKEWAERLEREAEIPPPYKEVDEYLLKKKKVPPVSGGAPSMFEKFTAKNLPVPQNMWDPGYKSTQDILGKAKIRGYEEVETAIPYENWVVDSGDLPRLVADTFQQLSPARPHDPMETLLRTARFTLGTSDPTQLEMAAALKQALMANPALLDRMLTKERAIRMSEWMQKTLADYDKLKKLPPISGGAPSRIEPGFAPYLKTQPTEKLRAQIVTLRDEGLDFGEIAKRFRKTRTEIMDEYQRAMNELIDYSGMDPDLIP